MKALPNGPESAKWEYRLVNDLAFIKKHGRYPINKKTLGPSIVLGGLFLYLIRVIGLIPILSHSGNLYLSILFAGFMILSLLAIIRSYFKTLKFVTIPSPYYLNENEKALKQFLEIQHLAYTRLKDAPEVFAILSRNISFSKKREQREVMIFIADNKRILVNSHFTNQRFTFSPSLRNYDEMAKQLHRWLNTPVNNNNTSIIPK